MTKEATNHIAALLERCGYSLEDARAAALEAISHTEEAAPGTGYGLLTPYEIGQVWQRAARAGARRIVFEIVADSATAEDDTGHVTARVLDVQKWAEWTPEHQAQRAAADALLNNWSEVDY